MSSAQVLDPSGTPINVQPGVSLSTPGLKGIVEPFARNRLGAPHVSTPLLEALNKSGIEPQAILQISAAQEQAGNGTVRTSYGEPAMVLEVDDPGTGRGQLVMQTDESGVTTWNFATNAYGSSSTGSGTTKRNYLLRRKVLAPPDLVPKPAVAGVTGTKAIHVLNFTWDPIGDVAAALVGAWEDRNRPYRVRWFTPQNYQAGDVPDLSPADWDELASDKSLLIVHGTFSQAHTDFGRFPADFVARLNARYNGRVFAFDHPTLAKDPTQNAQWFIDAMPAGLNLNLDIMCHSRGGLVSRVFAEKLTGPQAEGRQVTVDKLVFIASPNAGTILTNVDHLAEYIESYTNMLNFGPVNGMKDILEVLVTIAKGIAAGAASGLTGLESMRPGGTYLDYLNTGTSGNSSYFALGSDFEPPAELNTGYNGWFSDRIDGIFNDANDSIVPTNGVWQAYGTGYFPLDSRQYVILPDSAGVDHGGFFQSTTAQDYIAGWLCLP